MLYYITHFKFSIPDVDYPDWILARDKTTGFPVYGLYNGSKMLMYNTNCYYCFRYRRDREI